MARTFYELTNGQNNYYCQHHVYLINSSNLLKNSDPDSYRKASPDGYHDSIRFVFAKLGAQPMQPLMAVSVGHKK